MARDISVSIAVQGDKEFNRALKDAQSAVKVLASELKASEAAFDENADAQAFFANKTRLIQEQIDQQKTILESLKKAVQEAGQEFGETSAKTDKYRIELNRAEASIAKLERSLRKTQQEAEEFGRDSTRIGRQMEDGIGEAADDVSDKLDRMVKQIESDLSDIGGAVEFSAFKDAADMAMGAFEQLDAFTEGSEDYRRSMSYLEQNAMNAGHEFEYVKGLLFDAASLTGDLDGAFEGISNLLATGFDGKELEEAIDLIGGAVVRFPETMKFENLAESLQESVAAGSATGAYAELLERLGVDLETVNKALGEAETLEGRQQAALAFLNEHGLEETAQNYKDMNADLIANEEAQLKYNDALAKLGETLSPTATAFTKFKTSVVTGITELAQSEGVKSWLDGFTEGIQGIADYISGADEVVGMAWEEFNSDLSSKMHGTIGGEAGITLFDAEEWKAALENMKAGMGEAMEQFAQWLGLEGTEAGKEGASGIAAGLTADEETLLANAVTMGSNIATSVGNGITNATENAIRAASSLWESIKNILSQTISIPTPTFDPSTYNGTGRTTASSYAAGGQNTVTVVTKIDSDTVAKTVAGGVGSELGSQANRASTYNR